MVGQFAAHKGASDMRLAGIGPTVDFGLHVVAMTHALGELKSPKDEQPEIFRWADAGESHVTCTFVGGKLAHHELFRPAPDAPPADSPPAP